MQGGGGEPRPGGAGFGDGAGDGGGDGCEGGGDGAARRMKHRKLLVLSLSGFCGYTALVTPLVTPAFHFSQRAGLPSSGILTSYPMQSATAEQREPHSALLVGALTASKSLKPTLVKIPSEGPSALWAQAKTPSTQLRQPPKFSSKTVAAGGGDGDSDGGGGDCEGGGGDGRLSGDGGGCVDGEGGEGGANGLSGGGRSDGSCCGDGEGGGGGHA